jgi:hypothetical protein
MTMTESFGITSIYPRLVSELTLLIPLETPLDVVYGHVLEIQ